jgi:hypothetical protein
MSHQPSSVLHEIVENGKSLRSQQNALLAAGLSAPETLVSGVEPKRGKLFHGRLHR